MTIGIALWVCLIRINADTASVVVTTDGSTESAAFTREDDMSARQSRQVRADGVIIDEAAGKVESVQASASAVSDGAATATKDQRQVRTDGVITNEASKKETETVPTDATEEGLRVIQEGDSPTEFMPSSLLEANMSYAAERYAISTYFHSLGLDSKDTHSVLMDSYGLGAPFELSPGSAAVSKEASEGVVSAVAPEGSGVLLEVAASKTNAAEEDLEREGEVAASETDAEEGYFENRGEVPMQRPAPSKKRPPLDVKGPSTEELEKAEATPTRRLHPGGIDHPTMHSHKRLMEHLQTIVTNSRNRVLDDSVVEQFKKRLLLTQKKDDYSRTINDLTRANQKERTKVKHAQQACLLGLLRFGETTDDDDLETVDVAFDRWKTFLQTVHANIVEMKRLREEIFKCDEQALSIDKEAAELFRNMQDSAHEMKQEVGNAATKITALKQFSELKYTPAVGKVPDQSDATS